MEYLFDIILEFYVNNQNKAVEALRTQFFALLNDTFITTLRGYYKVSPSIEKTSNLYEKLVENYKTYRKR